MKLNWGFGIALFYLSFMTILLYFVFKSTTYDHSLVMDNYYEEDLKYQEHYDKMSNQMALTKSLVISQNDEAQYLRFEFPGNMKEVKGKILLFCPSTKHRDIEKDIELDANNKMLIRTNNMVSGRWIIKADWTANDIPYYKETEIVL